MNDVRDKARSRRIQLGLELDAPTPAEEVLTACGNATGLSRHFLQPGDLLLGGAQAVLNVSSCAIFQDESLPLPRQRYDAAHEFAHFWLHRGDCHCASTDLDPEANAEAAQGAMSRVDGYSPRQRQESEANLFAAELLLPGPLARRLFLAEGKSSEAIAAEMGLPGDLVQKQLSDALLLPCEAAFPAAPHPASAPVSLDPSQTEAAHAPSGPLLLGAGPGTGKTKTLVGRCQFLQAQGVPPPRILALTFSRKAAQEMRNRLRAAGVGTESAGPWVGTFHGFGLETLRRFGERLGLPDELRLLDTVDTLTLLENHLAELGLDALDNLYDPATHLPGILGQIKRAKDELCPPERYAQLCAAMGAQARASADSLATRPGKILVKDREAAEKAAAQAAKADETARVYTIYERLMQEGGWLDYGDLITRTVTLLETHPEVRAQLQSEYPHVLADEYQDVNRACARLVKLLAGETAAGLWAVGDARQSIYQFQGASPANVAAFERDYPAGKRLELGVNYRSRRPVVEMFGAAAAAMGDSKAGWDAFRGVDENAALPAITVAAAPDPEGQADGIAKMIQEHQAAGCAYSRQAILCRSHAGAEALAGLISARSVPVLYLGQLLERAEIKDLVCLLSLFADTDGTALLRVAALPEYAVPQAETLALLAKKQHGDLPLLDALADPALHPGLRRLHAHLTELDTIENDPAALLRHYLFGVSHFLRDHEENLADPLGRISRGLAIHQLLSLASTFERRLVAPRTNGGPPHPIREFLAHLRRLSAAGDLRGSLPDEADAVDAVRILTAHAAKGLEYPVVFLPNLGAGQFPSKGRHDGLREPPGLTEALEEGQAALDEEQCLFFVALSRARDHLIVSRAETSDKGRRIAPSPLLELIAPHLEASGLTETLWLTGRDAECGDEDFPPESTDTLPEYSVSALETYERCPRQYHYKQTLKLPGVFFSGGYPQFHACVRQTLHWLEDRRATGPLPSEDELNAQMEIVWVERGPVGHLHEEKYKAEARRMLAAARQESSLEPMTGPNTLRATLANCRVRVRPDALRRDTATGGVVVVRHLTGRPGKEDHTQKRLALYRRAAQQAYPDAPVRIEICYLANGETKPVDPPETKQQMGWEAGRLAKYEKAAQGIGADLFPARPETKDECGKCAYALICPL